VLQQCLVTFSIKCFITVNQHLSPSKQQLDEMLTHRQELIQHLKDCIGEVHKTCIPSARAPIAYLDCPLDHKPDFPPHVPLDNISITKDILCRQSQNQPIPKESYILLLEASVCNSKH